MNNLFQYLKGLAIVGWGIKAIKQLWPFLLAIIFWPEIDALLGGIFPFWNQYMGTVSGYIINLTTWIRDLPGLGNFFKWLDDAFVSIRVRLIDILSA